MEEGAAARVAALLGRATEARISARSRGWLAGKRVLVTGAGGSIGSELVRVLARTGVASISLLDRDESLLHAVQLEVFGDVQLTHERVVLGDLRDREALIRRFTEIRPDIVFHAAALKHVSMLERYPAEAIRTNTIGTQNVVDACVAAGVSRLVFVSTDKAADPTSVLGASKHLGEGVVRAAAGPRLRTASVRFGNVLGSRGSLLHTVTHQIRSGLPVTITHPDAERYLMSIPEAASLVVEAATLAGRGDVYVLDMGEPVKIVDVVQRLAAVLGVAPVSTRVIGLAPGEKLTEVLSSATELQEITRRSKISRIVSTAPVPDEVLLEKLFDAAHGGDDESVRGVLLAAGYALTVAPEVIARPVRAGTQARTRGRSPDRALAVAG